MASSNITGLGSLHIAELDVHLINEALRLIEDQLNLLRGLTINTSVRSTTSSTSTSSSTTSVTIGKHSHESDTTGGQISHDAALTGVSNDDHHDKLHHHNGLDGSGILTFDVDMAEGCETEKPWDHIIAGSGITITELDESGAIVLSSSGASSLTVQEEDGVPSVANVTTINVTNGTLTDNGGGSVSISISGSSQTDQALYDAASTVETTVDHIFAGDNIILTEMGDGSGDAFKLTAMSVVMNGDADTPEPIFANGDLIYA